MWTTITSDFYAGQWVQGVAYKWGGWDTLEQFQTNLNNGLLAGDTYKYNYVSCPGGGTEKPVFYNATGADCSGFVTRVWGRDDQKYSTSTLPNISTVINFDTTNRNTLVPKMRMGDIFDYIRNHVVLFRYFDPAPGEDNRPYFYEANWTQNRVVYSDGWDKIAPLWNGSSGYRPYRYHNIVDDTHLPDVRVNYQGWTSTIVVRNNSDFEQAVVQITFYDGNGKCRAYCDAYRPRR